MVSSAAESAGNMYLSPTGRQLSPRRGPVTARIAQVGAALRELTVDGVGCRIQPVNTPATLFRRSGIADHCLQMP